MRRFPRTGGHLPTERSRAHEGERRHLAGWSAQSVLPCNVGRSLLYTVEAGVERDLGR
jgi:hypothetical protein